MASEAHLSEEKAQKAMIDAARLADELRGEQEHAQVGTNFFKVNLYQPLLARTVPYCNILKNVYMHS
jgi:hypothetical protein